MTAHPAITNLLENQQQLDADGCMVGVSRQALEEVIGIVKDLLGIAHTALDYADDMAAGALISPSGMTFRDLGREDAERFRAIVAQAEGKS